jgi:hypothetical protein
MEKTYGNYRRVRISVRGLIICLILVILVSTIGPMPVSADVLWSDDFNDGNYDGWTIHGYNFTHYPALPITPCDGEFSAADYTLKATGPEYNYAAPPMGYAIIFFSVSNFSQFLTGFTGYSLLVYTDGRLKLKRHDGMPPIETIGKTETA